MRKANSLVIVSILIAISWWLAGNWGTKALLLYLGVIVILELLSWLLVLKLRNYSPLFITPKDETPELSKDGLFKFFKHGYDPELGWIRKPNTSKQERSRVGLTSYSIDEKGARRNPGHEHLPAIISCYGDSFTFARQVNDDQTWGWYLSEMTKSNVLNFGVGNYGVDQAFLRLKREYPQNKTKIVIMGIVPSTILRILAVWKHYHDYGNTFGFKPIYLLKDGKLQLTPNFIDSQEKFDHYQDYLPQIQKLDHFYDNKFKKEMLQFPYLVSILSNPHRNIPLITAVMVSALRSRENGKEKQRNDPRDEENKIKQMMDFLATLKGRFFIPTKYHLYSNKYAVDLLTAIIEEFKRYCQEQGSTPVLVWMPQKDDITLIKRRGLYYKNFVDSISDKINVIDLTSSLLRQERIDTIYAEDSADGGHFSPEGNRFVAEEITKALKEKDFL
ncbi:hypothetical protein COV20_03875 [Candidatus Woesearchaeota archaeon CG10_big_fil_rev_8_21_14_0_10_45_16]|nr:MAG: hypothetical protein COV20_03875 [Candidatus Woesearchaeota archaeon CG10_big_fil_rev_8_21_14_0_10_45_16]